MRLTTLCGVIARLDRLDRAIQYTRTGSTALPGSSMVDTVTLLGPLNDEYTSSGKSLKFAGTVITGTMVCAESVGPAPLLLPM